MCTELVKGIYRSGSKCTFICFKSLEQWKDTQQQRQVEVSMPVYDVCEGVQGQSRKSHILDLHHSQVCHGEISRSTSDSCVVKETTCSASLNGNQVQHPVIRKGDAERSGNVHKDRRKLLALPDSLSFTRAGSVSLMICKSAKVLKLKQRLSAGTEKMQTVHEYRSA